MVLDCYLRFCFVANGGLLPALCCLFIIVLCVAAFGFVLFDCVLLACCGC